jgi:hypothetical protein
MKKLIAVLTILFFLMGPTLLSAQGTQDNLSGGKKRTPSQRKKPQRKSILKRKQKN